MMTTNSGESDLITRVTEKRLFMIKNGANKIGIAPGCGPQYGPPPWYDPVLFQQAQKLFRTYEVV